jgi:REP element-mobilizing transposase RayT
MKLHRNSQKRYYIPGAIYFITMNARDRQPYFSEDILCQLFVDEIEIVHVLKDCDIIGYKVNPDHVHMLIKPSDKANYSECIRSLRTNFSRNANRVMERSRDEIDPEYIIAKSEEKSHIRRPGHVTWPSDVTVPSNEIPPDAAFSEMINKHSERISSYRDHFRKKYQGNRFMPVFRWQSRFHDHVIRDEVDLVNHIRYIENQWIKHGLKENKWLWINKKLDLGEIKGWVI